MTFLNGYFGERIFMVQPDGFVEKSKEIKIYKLHQSIYGLKQASRSWNIKFGQAVKSYGFEQNVNETIKDENMVFSSFLC